MKRVLQEPASVAVIMSAAGVDVELITRFKAAYHVKEVSQKMHGAASSKWVVRVEKDIMARLDKETPQRSMSQMMGESKIPEYPERVIMSRLKMLYSYRVKLQADYQKFKGLPKQYMEEAEKLRASEQGDYSAEANALVQLANDVEQACHNGTWPAYSIMHTKSSKNAKVRDLLKASATARQVGEELNALGETTCASLLLDVARDVEAAMGGGFFPPGVMMRDRMWPGGNDSYTAWSKPGCAGAHSCWGDSSCADPAWIAGFYKSLREDEDFNQRWKVQVDIEPLEKWYGCPKFDAKHRNDEHAATSGSTPEVDKMVQSVGPQKITEQRSFIIAEAMSRYEFYIRKALEAGAADCPRIEYERRMLLLMRKEFLALEDPAVTLVQNTYPVNVYETGRGKERNQNAVYEPKVLRAAYGTDYNPHDVSLLVMPPLPERWQLLLLHTVPNIPERLEAIALLADVKFTTGFMLDGARETVAELQKACEALCESEAAEMMQSVLHAVLACANYLNHDDGRENAMGFEISDFDSFLSSAYWRDNNKKNSIVESAFRHLAKNGVEVDKKALTKLQKEISSVLMAEDKKSGRFEPKKIELWRRIEPKLLGVIKLRDRLQELAQIIQPVKRWPGEDVVEDTLLSRMTEAITTIQGVCRTMDPVKVMEDMYRAGGRLIIKYARLDVSSDCTTWFPHALYKDPYGKDPNKHYLSWTGAAFINTLRHVFEAVEVVAKQAKQMRALDLACAGLSRSNSSASST